MALKVPQSSFSAGELDPILHERTTLQKFKTGLATARNWIVGKTGSIFTRPSRQHLYQTKLDDSAVKGYSPPNSGILLEFGHEYVRIYNTLTNTLLYDIASIYTEAMLAGMHFDTSGKYVYIFVSGVNTSKLDYMAGTFVAGSAIYGIPAAGTNLTVTPTGAPSGYPLDYAVTYVKSGEESVPYFAASGSLPVSAGQLNSLDLTIGASPMVGVTEIRVYRRPQNGGVYGYIGSSSVIFTSGGNVHGTFTDLGQSADYSHSPPSIVNTDPPPVIPLNFWSNTGTIYQQRLIVTDPTNDPERILASRPGLQNNFMRDFPLNSDSALRFKSGTSGRATVLRMIEADGLVVFTTMGVFLNTGALGPDNIALEKKGKWVINPTLPPLAVPGGVLFLDAATNTVRNLLWSTELAGYNGQEMSIFSNHLFRERGVTSWAFQEGNLPVLWVTFDDGTYATFTYEFDQEMKAWTRHDSLTDVEQVIGTGLPDKTFFITKKDTKRYIEMSIPRFIPATLFRSDPEADKNPSAAFMDSMVSFANLLNNSLVGSDKLVLTPVNPDEWDGPLTLTCGTSGIFTAAGAGKIGNILRAFDNKRSKYDLKVTARASDNSVTVTPDPTFPEYMGADARLYLTAVRFTGLSHLDGEAVSIMVDGAVVASPNNNIDNYEDQVVNGDDIELPEEFRGAIVHIGRPVTADLETLDIDTVEQAPTIIESKTVNKLYVKTFESRGLFLAHKFPPMNKVNTWTQDETLAMQPLDVYFLDYDQENPLIGNRYPQPTTRRHEVMLPGDWDSNGKIAIRQVDPVHAQILSIITDVEVLQRSDR